MITLIQQVALFLFSVALAIFVRHQLRRGALSFLFALMWVVISAVGVLSSALIPFVGRIGTFVGLLPAAILAGSASVLLGVVALVLSLRISALEERQLDLTIAIAMATPPEVPSPERSGRDVIAVVPALNEASTVGDVVAGLMSIGLPVLVVSDGSTDGTADVARVAGASVLELPKNLGVGGALRAGFQVALSRGYDCVLQCDADGQHPVESVLRLIDDHKASPVDLLIGSRFHAAGARREVPLVRRTAMIVLSAMASRAAKCRITDATSGLRMIRTPLLAELAAAMPTHFLGDTFEVNVMAGRSGYRIREIPVAMRPRVVGSSSASSMTAFRLTIRGILVVLLRAQRNVARRPAPGVGRWRR